MKLQLKIERTTFDATADVLAHVLEFGFSNDLFSPDQAHLDRKVFGRSDSPSMRAQIVSWDDFSVKNLAQAGGQAWCFMVQRS